MPDTYTLLEKVTVGATNATTVTFTSIPQTYTDLVLMCTIRTTGGIQAIDFRFNNDTGSNYSWRYIQGTGAGIDNGTGSGQTIFSEAMVANGSASTVNTFSNSTLYIPNYTANTAKSFSLDTVEEENATNAYSRLEAGLWNNTAAITSINLSASGDFVQHSTFYLYGVAKLGVTPTSAPKATGGDIIVSDGTYWIHTFLSSGTFTPKTSLSCDYLVVAGGGGAGSGAGGGGGAGGAGGLRSTVSPTGGGGSAETKITMNNGTAYTVTVGAAGGGGGGGDNGQNGSNSSISGSGLTTITSIGGGGGGSTNAGAINGSTGGSGGGGGKTSNGTGGAGTANQGYAGSAGNATYGGGGGGAGGAAGTPTAGAGVSNSISGTATTYAVGGTGRDGGAGSTVVGAGGSYDNSANGQKGIVIIRYAIV